MSVDLNPLIVVDGKPVAVDALVELAEPPPAPRGRPRRRPARRRAFRALFEPRGVIVAGASTHPGKFGFVALHNILAAGYPGRVGATNLEATPVLGDRHRPHHRRAARRAVGPRVRLHARGRQRRAAPRVREARACAPRSSRARATARRARRAAAPSASSSTLADELGILLAGPNGQGVVSTPARTVRADRCALPARGPHRDREPVGQLRLVVRELGGADRRRRQPGRERRQRGRGRRSPTTSTGTPTTTRPRSASRTSKASPTAGRCSSASPRSRAASPSCS